MTVLENQPASPSRKGRSFQYNLRMVMIFVVLAAVGLSWLGVKLEDAAPAKPERPDNIHQTERATAQSRRSETNNARNVYARGVVTLKTGRTVGGHILLQCPGYLTVCFKIGSFEKGDSELVSFEEVRSVVLEEALSDVDPQWMALRKEMTIVSPGP
jgi:hypothetical protein